MISNCSTFDGKTVHFSVAIYMVLLHHWGEKFDQRKWDRLTNEVCFHKLAFRESEEVKKDKENYYNYILTEYGRI